MSIQKKVEKNLGVLMVMIVLVVSLGGLVEALPLFFQTSTTQPIKGLEPYSPIRLAGRDIYLREQCSSCHSQMIRPFRAETERYGHYSVAGEFVYDRPFQWGSKRTGPDLARVGGRYSDEWHRVHLVNPRNVVPASIMPSYPWLEDETINVRQVQKSILTLRDMGHPYTHEDFQKAKELEDVTEMEALIAYLQGLGVELQR